MRWKVPYPHERELTEARKEITFCIPITIILHLHIWWKQSRAYYIEGNISDIVQLTLPINTRPAVHILCHHFLKPLFPLSAVTRTPLPTIAWKSPPPLIDDIIWEQCLKCVDKGYIPHHQNVEYAILSRIPWWVNSTSRVEHDIYQFRGGTQMARG